MSKFIDLHDEIEDDLGSTRAAIERILEWLDYHPDQVPGPTITESRIAEGFGPDYVAWARMCLSRIGVTVIPDPEPTNAELINEAYDVWDRDPQAFTFGEYLDHLGWAKSHD